MLTGRLLTRACTVTRRTDSGEVDEFGNAVMTDTDTTTVCELQQQRRTEPNAQGELSDTTWLLVLPYRTTIGTGDVVTVDDDAYEVVGDPWRVRHPRTGIGSHIEATLRRTA